MFCLEVFEHLPRRETVHTIREINRLLGREGTLVVGCQTNCSSRPS